MASLQNISAPLPLYICKLLSDVKSLDAITDASPVFAAVFTHDCAERLETLLAATSHEGLTALIRAHVLLRGQRHAFHPVIDPDSAVAAWTALHAETATPLSRGGTDAPAAAATVRVFKQIHSLTTALLGAKLVHLPTLRFEHLEDVYFCYNRDDPLRYNPAGREYKVGKLSPPSWTEEQRVMRALWRIKLFSDLALAFIVAPTSNTVGTTEIGSDEVNMKSSVQTQEDIFRALRNTLLPTSKDEFDEILQIVISLPYYSTTDGPSPNMLLVATISACFSSAPITWDPPAASPSPSSSREAWEPVDPLINGKGAKGHGFFHAACKGSLHSPMKYTNWIVLRQLGLGLWDWKRMAEELELFNLPPAVRPPMNGRSYRIGVDNYMSTSAQFFTWRQLYYEELSRTKDRRKFTQLSNIPSNVAFRGTARDFTLQAE